MLEMRNTLWMVNTIKCAKCGNWKLILCIKLIVMIKIDDIFHIDLNVCNVESHLYTHCVFGNLINMV